MVAVVDLVGADVLGDAAGLAGGHLGLADRVEQRRLAVVDVAHDRDHRRALDQLLVAVLVGRLLLHVIRRGVEGDLLVEALGEHLDGLVGEGLRERGHLAQLHQLLDDLGGRQLQRLRDLLDGRARANRDGRILLERRGGCRRCLRLEIRLHPLGTAPTAAPTAGRLLRRRRSAIAPRSLRIDYDAPAAATAAATAATLAAAAATGGPCAAAAAATAGAAAGSTGTATASARAIALTRGACGLGRLRGRSLLKNSRAASLGTGALHVTLGRGRTRDRGPDRLRLALGLALLRGRLLSGRLLRGSGLGCGRRATVARLRRGGGAAIGRLGRRSRAAVGLRLGLRAVTLGFGLRAAGLRIAGLRAALRLRAVGLRGCLLRLRGGLRRRRSRSVAERLRCVGLFHARCGRGHAKAGLLENLQGLLRGDPSLFSYLVDALLCHSVMKSKVSCCTVTGARKVRASGRPVPSLAAQSGLAQT